MGCEYSIVWDTNYALHKVLDGATLKERGTMGVR